MCDVKIVKVLTPDSYKKLNRFDITYGFYESRFGKCLIGLHDNYLCYLSFKTEPEIYVPMEYLKHCFPGAVLIKDEKLIAQFAEELFNDMECQVKVLLLGTEFQTNVWKALLEIKAGGTASYEDVAKMIENPRAVRAVANAIANNKVAYAIPCHRVIRKNGNYVGKYRWGVERKIKMLQYEGVSNFTE